MDRAEGEGTHSYGRTSAFYQRTIFILNNKDITMIKLKNILSEAYAWEREEGKPLPTLAQTTAAYAAKLAEQSAAQDLSDPMDEPIEEEAKPDFLDLDDDGNEEEAMKDAAEDAEDKEDVITIKSTSKGKDDVKEAFARRMRGNLKGSEHILSETFKK